MTESKFKKVVAASIVGAIMLIIILVTVIVYQVVTMSGYIKQRDSLIEGIARLEQMIEDNASEEEIRTTKEWIEEQARKIGYKYPNDIIIDDDDIIIDGTRYEDVLKGNN